MEYEKCYIFTPDDARPAKRRRTEPQGLHASWRLRQKAYQQAWATQRQRIDAKLAAINAVTVDGIAAFLNDAVLSHQQTERIPAGFILAGPNSGLNTSLATQVQAKGHAKTRRIFASISAGAASNLKNALKAIIQRATSRTIEDEDDELEELATSTKKGPKLLNYDLQILHEHVNERRIEQVVVALEDTEAFDGEVLSELLLMLGCWKDRIPFALLLNIATSVDFLQQRLSKAAVKCLDGRLFDAALSGEEVQQVFHAVTDRDTRVWLGSGVTSMMLERQQDYIQGVESLVQAVQYAYMSCYYANALSIFLDPELSLKDVPKDHFEALRNLGSFRAFGQRLLDDGQDDRLRRLLDNDRELFELARESITNGRRAIADNMVALKAIRSIQVCVPNALVTTRSSLYTQAMSGKLGASPMLRTLLLTVRNAPSDVARNMIEAVCALDVPESVESEGIALIADLSALIADQTGPAQPLRSEDDLKNSTFRTTIVSKKVELSKQKSALSKQDSAYTALLRRFSDMLETYFADTLVNPKQLLMHEIFIYDLKSPYRETFTPRPRHAIERALAAPHDYLNCECCAPGREDAEEEATLAASQPATAVLYQLYLESGSLINASDLWQAFQAVMGDAQHEDEASTMALFQRALAELRYLGFVKSTRKRVDHIAKVAWRGL